MQDSGTSVSKQEGSRRGKERQGERKKKRMQGNTEKRQRGKKESREEGERGKAGERGRRKQIPYQCFSMHPYELFSTRLHSSFPSNLHSYSSAHHLFAFLWTFCLPKSHYQEPQPVLVFHYFLRLNWMNYKQTKKLINKNCYSDLGNQHKAYIYSGSGMYHQPHVYFFTKYKT